MRNSLPEGGPLRNESAIINLDDKNGPGTHWTAYKKTGSHAEYFDSFGNLKPPPELCKYLKNSKIYYNHSNYQEFDTVVCGHLCLKFLSNQLNNKRGFYKISL